MINVLFSFIIASIVGTIIWVIQTSARPFTQKVFSQTWHYYAGLIPVFFLLGGTEIVNRMVLFVRSMLSITSTNPSFGPALEQQLSLLAEQPIGDSSSFMKPVVDSLLKFPKIEQLVQAAMIIWGAGIAVFLIANVIKYQAFKKTILQQSRECPTPAALKSVQVITSPAATTPMVLGFWKPVIVLPDTQLGEKELAMILSHELMHVKRRDLLVKSLVLLANAVHWFNPFAYLLNKQTHIYCELSCDEMVVREMDTENRKFYGRVLLSMLEYGVMRKTVMGTSSLLNPKENMKRRLGNLMSVKKTKKSIAILSLAASITLISSGGAAAYAAGSALKIPTGEQVEGRNIYVQSPDGRVVYYDRNGNVTAAQPRKQPRYDADTQSKIDELTEKIQSYLDQGLQVPQEIIDAYTPEEIAAALLEVSSYVYDEKGLRPYSLDDSAPNNSGWSR
ncbi:M56 family metallopeptidase [Paenibacillus senegalensis]|uniref:M56 family metallopeptidase n=1 Tax=Paenibacillus senegalensis TaxID=1465766 RepID=UPI000287BBDC|nr:M56 family metallopeptidase [Paenibacillus senegalensis]